MATRGNDINAALAQASENVLRMIMQRQQLAMEHERLEFAREQFSEEQQANAFQRVATLIPLMKPGTTSPLIADELQKIFPEQDRATIEELVSVPQTFENIVRPALIERFQGLPEEQKSRIMEMATNRALLGEATTDEAIELQDNIIGTQLESVQNILKDPEMMEAIGRKSLGLEQPIRINLGGREISFDTADAARLSVEIWKHNSMMNWYRQQAALDNSAKSDIAGELIKLAGEKGIGISRAGAMQIINAVHWAPDNADTLPPDEVARQRQEKIQETFQQLSPEMQTVMSMYLNGAKLADEVPAWITEQFPGLGEFLTLGTELEKAVGKELTSTILPVISREMSKRGTGIAAPQRFGILPFRSSFNLGEIRAPDLSREAAHADADKYAKGEISLSELTRKWGAQKAKAIVADANRIK